MREALFIKKNEKRWGDYEQLTDQDPDQLADSFVALMDDLSYAQTYYPKSKLTYWLNSIAVSIYQSVYKKKRQSISRLYRFWAIDLPTMFYQYRFLLLITFVLFLLMVFMGVLSAKTNPDFVRGILGSDYVSMTETNISSGDPFGVYRDENKFAMFVRIALNNIKVGFMTVFGGIFLGLGTLWVFFQNCIMLGSFQYYFFAKDLGYQSVLVIWIHGTIEISAMIIEACAGFIIARSILMPGTYKRMYSFRKGVKSAVKICISIIPFTIVAALLESYVTYLGANSFDQHLNTGLPIPVLIAILLLSLLLIVWYFVWYPYKLNRKLNPHKS